MKVFLFVGKIYQLGTILRLVNLGFLKHKIHQNIVKCL